MRIIKARLSHATNSSSTHSLLFVDPNEVPRCSADNEYGWDDFIASSTEAKDTYFGIMLYNSLQRAVGDKAAAIITKEMSDGPIKDIQEGYIDHQSFNWIPLDWAGKVPDLDFAKELREYLLRKDLVILGGNDNSDGHPLAENSITMPWDSYDCYSADVVCRKDPQGYWTVFNKDSGSKVRFSFGDDEMVIDSAQYPELIDIKLTDFCATGCEYCYQDSTPQGEHAEASYLDRIAYLCQEMKVFEVALGGGEPLAHPKFEEILTRFRDYGIVPSFSTRNTSWLKDPAKAQRISDLCGAWALSVDDTDPIDEAAAAANYLGIKKPTIHLVLEGTPEWQFERLLKSCAEHNLRVVILGFKETGRGETAKRHDPGKWLPLLKELGIRASIDTTVVKQYADEIKAADVPEYFLEHKEGCFSMYIDAVAQTMGESSFVPKSEMKEVGNIYSAAPIISESMGKWSNRNRLQVVQ